MFCPKEFIRALSICVRWCKTSNRTIPVSPIATAANVVSMAFHRWRVRVEVSWRRLQLNNHFIALYWQVMEFIPDKPSRMIYPLPHGCLVGRLAGIKPTTTPFIMYEFQFYQSPVTTSSPILSTWRQNLGCHTPHSSCSEVRLIWPTSGVPNTKTLLSLCPRWNATQHLTPRPQRSTDHHRDKGEEVGHIVTGGLRVSWIQWDCLLVEWNKAAFKMSRT